MDDSSVTRWHTGSPIAGPAIPRSRAKRAGTRKRERPIFGESVNGHTCFIHHAEGSTLLDTLADNTVDLLFLDPPFNIGKEYEIDGFVDRGDPDVYFGWLVATLRRCISKLRDGGALYLYHLPSVAYRAAGFLDQHLQFRHWIAISMKGTFARGQRLYPAHYALLYFTKGDPRHFVRPKVKPRVCRHCKGLIKDYGGYRSIIEAKGLNLSDVWDDLSPLRHSSTKMRGANELPSEFFSRIMTISGLPGGTYVDPFMGSGGGVESALRAHMKVVASDASRKACDVVIHRIQDL